MRYKEIAERLAERIMIHHQPGDRLPGLREFARQERISLVTARNVYQHLGRQGIITLRQGAGTYVAGAWAQGPVDMSSIRPPEAMLAWVEGYLKASMDGLLAYDPPEGYGPLRRAAQEWLGSQGVEGMPIITGGAQQALFLTGLTLLKPGDRVVVEEPGYIGARRIFESLGAQVISMPCPRRAKDLGPLQRPGTRLFYTMPQAHIPTGANMADEVRSALVELAGRRDFFILEDDPLSDIVGAVPLKARDTRDRVVYVKSLSNILGPGLRLGLCVMPAALEKRFLQLKEINDLSLSGILQRMFFEMLASGDLARHVLRLKAELERRWERLRAHGVWQGGGACLWLDTGSPGRLHAENLKRQGIKIMPGDIYGAVWAHHIRVSLLTPPREELFKALDSLHAYLGHGTPDLITLI
ncbi:MAG TPA: PLP-dependent aminotransferase family protein [Deltaproteobacteria bacterium]|nr:PLP-dependent aminotransferase family protein [Deltaproteobacteria bacterium]